MTRSNAREPFDVERSYAVSKAMTFQGIRYAPGDHFPREATNTRRLRQLYEQRYLTFEPEGAGGLDLATFTFEELRTFLADHGVIPSPRWGRDKMLEKGKALIAGM